ncbi:hypothetical protein D3C81_1835420 [compost metagenome]
MRNLQKLLIGTPREICNSDIGDQSQLHATLSVLACEVRFERAQILASDSAPNIQLVASQPHLKAVVSCCGLVPAAQKIARSSRPSSLSVNPDFR